MASPLKPRAGLNGATEPVLAFSNAGDLPPDAVYEILLRLPAKELCRLRAVCRSWRWLLSDPGFAAAHRRREPPLIIVSYDDSEDTTNARGWNPGSLLNRIKGHRWNPGSLIRIMDLSGHIVKKLRFDSDRVMNMALGELVCVRRFPDGACRLLDPATAALYYQVRENMLPFDCDFGMHLFGQVASTGEHKAFRKVTYSHVGEYGFLYEICTLSRSSGSPRWRAVQGPPDTSGWTERDNVAIGGVVYFLMADVIRRMAPVDQRDWIYSFDLETEKWRPNIKGPQGVSLADNVFNLNGHYREIQLSLANLNGSLVIVHGPCPSMDIWFLMDSEKGIWVKQYSIRIERTYTSFWPLFVLDDGRIVIVIHVGGGRKQSVEIHDPRTNTFSVVADTSYCNAISVYTGNLLSLEWWHRTNNEKKEQEQVMHDGAERTQKVPKDALDFKRRWVSGFCQVKSLCGLTDAFLSVMLGKSGFS